MLGSSIHGIRSVVIFKSYRSCRSHLSILIINNFLLFVNIYLFIKYWNSERILYLFVVFFFLIFVSLFGKI